MRGDNDSVRPFSSALSVYKYVYDAIAAKQENESRAVSKEQSIPSEQIRVRRRWITTLNRHFVFVLFCFVCINRVWLYSLIRYNHLWSQCIKWTRLIVFVVAHPSSNPFRYPDCWSLSGFETIPSLPNTRPCHSFNPCAQSRRNANCNRYKPGVLSDPIASVIFILSPSNDLDIMIRCWRKDELLIDAWFILLELRSSIDSAAEYHEHSSGIRRWIWGNELNTIGPS